jgi:hypothetical protein
MRRKAGGDRTALGNGKAQLHHTLCTLILKVITWR